MIYMLEKYVCNRILAEGVLMAKLPTPEETGSAMIDYWKGMNVRADETAPLQAAQVELLRQGYRTEDLNAALEYMQQAGLIEPARPGFVKLTQAGYGPNPSSEEIRRAVLDALGDLSVRAGDAVPIQPLWIRLMKQGYNNTEFADAIDGMTVDGLVEMRGQTAFLTDAGFEAI